ncbi:hypothetical protein L484_024381 [Morus notabilis]|uniref:Uncharacterized protein n=1 Tax=Morus notabilis TaxID=981085 RepID=W9RX06_9ROSA|nr:hypothetical protein L484_024381 [Morus notabilis]
MAVFGGSLHTSTVGPTGGSGGGGGGGGGGLEAGEPVKLESRLEIMRSLKKPFEARKKNDLLCYLWSLKIHR